MWPSSYILWVSALTVVSSACYTPQPRLDSPDQQLGWARARLPTSEASPKTSPPTDCVSTEANAVALAIARHPEVARRQSRARALTAESRISQADAPKLRLSDMRLNRWIDGPARAELELRVPIARPGTLAAEADGLLLEAEVEHARAATFAREASLDVRVAWAKRAHWDERARLAEAEASLLRTAHARYTDHAKSAQVSGLEVLESETALARADGEALATRSEIARWDAYIQTATGAVVCPAPSPSSPSPTDRPSPNDPTGDLARLAADQGLVDKALGRRPEVAALMSERALTEVETALAERSAWPWLEWVQLGYHFEDAWSATTWGFALSIELPFSRWDGAAADAARTRGRGVDEHARRVVEHIRAEVEAAQAELTQRLDALTAIETLVAKHTPERIEHLRTQGRGEVTSGDLVGLERDRLRLTRLVLEARLAVAEARAHLLAAIGE
jgi:outer membrane protein TolC